MVLFARGLIWLNSKGNNGLLTKPARFRQKQLKQCKEIKLVSVTWETTGQFFDGGTKAVRPGHRKSKTSRCNGGNASATYMDSAKHVGRKNWTREGLIESLWAWVSQREWERERVCVCVCVCVCEREREREREREGVVA